MAVQEHLEYIRQGTPVWNRWRRSHPERRPDLSGVSLSGVDLSGANLSNADLSNADLSNATFKNANFSNADLSGANLFASDLAASRFFNANLFRANLIAANLSNADLTGANFSSAYLIRADLSTAVIKQTIFEDVDLRNVKGLATVKHDKSSTTRLETPVRTQKEPSTILLTGTRLFHKMAEYITSLISENEEHFTCVITYSSPDQAFVERLYTDLQRMGVRCWYAEDMDTGDNIKKRIDESIRFYDKQLLVLSQHSITSNWVAYEVERALRKEPQGIPNVLYPIRLDKAILTCEESWVESIKRTRYIGDFEHWNNHDAYQKSFQRLLHALRPKATLNS